MPGGSFGPSNSSTVACSISRLRAIRLILVSALGVRRYWSLLAIANVLVGNSSSGIIEAPSLLTPVVNIGDRQRGRLRIGMIDDVALDAKAITRALIKVIDSPRAPVLRPIPTAYGDGTASVRVRVALEAFAAEPPLRRFTKENI